MRKSAVSLLSASLLGLALVAGSVQAAPSLAERRAIAAYQKDTYEDQLKAIQTAAGFEVPVEVQWDSIAVPDRSDRYADEGFWTKIYFTPLVKALQAVAADEMGREALGASLKKIVVHYDEATAPGSAYANGVTFADGVLTVNFVPYNNVDDVDARAAAIQKALEAGL